MDPEQPRAEPQADRQQPNGKIARRALFFIAASTFTVLLDRVLDWVFGLSIPVRLVSIVLLDAAAIGVIAWILTDPRVRRWLRDNWAAPAELFGFAAVCMVGVLLVRFVAPLTIEGWNRVAYRPCPKRVELRVLTAPETAATLRGLSARFADEQAKGKDCRPVHVSVYTASSFYDLEHSFQTDWPTLAVREGTMGLTATVLGPQPDVWIPPSSAMVRYIQSKGTSVGELESLGSIATSPLVLAVFQGQLKQQIGAQSGQTLKQILDAVAKDPQTPLARPNPETSEIGLVATMELFRRNTQPDPGQRRQADRRDEQWVARSPLPARNSLEMLCALRQAERATPQVAVLVPEHVLYDYNAGQPLGDGCAAQEPVLKLHAVYPNDVGALDYPFVRVSWPGQRSWDRRHLVDEFHRWLSAERLRTSALRDPRGSAGPITGPNSTPLAGRQEFVPGMDVRPAHPSGGELAAARARFLNARIPVSVFFAVDISGSMRAAISVAGSRLDRARSLIHTALKLLGAAESGDNAGLLTFPPAGQGGVTPRTLQPPGPATGEGLDALDLKADTLVAATGKSSPVYSSVATAIDAVPAGETIPAVVVLTDGDDRVNQGPDGGTAAPRPVPRFSAAWREQLIAKLKVPREDGARVRVVFLTIGAPNWCDGPGRELIEGGEEVGGQPLVSCRDATAADRESLLTEVIGDLRKGRQQ